MALLFVCVAAAKSKPRDTKPTAQVNKPPQFVLVSFDATPRGKELESASYYKALLDVRAKAPEGYPHALPSITLFYNTAVLQLSPWWRPKKAKGKDKVQQGWKGYLPAHRKFRATAITHAKDIKTIERAVESLKRLHAMGVELASHGVNHDRGKNWSKKRWHEEFVEFQRVVELFDLPIPKGFRGPFLDITPGDQFVDGSEPAYQVMNVFGIRHDASKVYGTKLRWPHKVKGTDIWLMPVPIAYDAVRKKKALLFGSYDLYTDQSFYEALVRMFRQRYMTNRAPLQIGGHGEHISVIARFLTEVCYLPDVRCVTHAALVDFMDSHPELNNKSQRVPRRLQLKTFSQNYKWLQDLRRRHNE